MRPKNNNILRFDNRELAKSCFCYFPIKAVYSDGFTIIVSGASNAEWMIYQQVVRLLMEKKIKIAITSY